LKPIEFALEAEAAAEVIEKSRKASVPIRKVRAGKTPESSPSASSYDASRFNLASKTKAALKTKAETIAEMQRRASSKKQPSKKKKRPFSFSRVRSRHVALQIVYLGDNYYGFASQGDFRKTVEEELRKAAEVCKLVQDSNNCNWACCGRTDKGVSSTAQVISAFFRTKFTSEKVPGCVIVYFLAMFLRKQQYRPVRHSSVELRLEQPQECSWIRTSRERRAC